MSNATTAKNTAGQKTAGNAGAPRRSHALNSVTLELNAAADLRSYNDGKWASVFAIHNKYRGKNKEPQSVPISVKFSDSTVAYALTAIKKGTHFVVTGELDYDKSDEPIPGTQQFKEFYRINASQLRVLSHKETPAPGGN